MLSDLPLARIRFPWSYTIWSDAPASFFRTHCLSPVSREKAAKKELEKSTKSSWPSDAKEDGCAPLLISQAGVPLLAKSAFTAPDAVGSTSTLPKSEGE